MDPYLSHHNYLNHRDLYAAGRNDHEDDGLLRRWFRAAVRTWKRRKMIAALRAMDDRLLKDIGIYRGDIEQIVNGFDDRELGMAPLAAGDTGGDALHVPESTADMRRAEHLGWAI